MSKKKYIFGLITISLVVFALFFLMNRLTGYTADDYIYSFFYKGKLVENPVTKINSVSDLLQSQINHWKAWNGRFVAHTMAQIFLRFDKIFFDICNSLAFLVLGYFMYAGSFIRSNLKNKNMLTLVLIYLYLWWYLPEMGLSALWVSGSSNYLWTSLFYISYLLLFYYLLENKNVFLSFLLLPLGFLAGGTNENAGPAIILILGLFLIENIVRTRKFKMIPFLSLFCSLSGFVLMMASPGSLARGKLSLSLGLLMDQVYTRSLFSLTKFGLIYVLILIMIFILFKQKRDDFSSILWFNIIIMIGHFASIYALVLSPEFPERTLFAPAVLLGITCFSLFNQVITNDFIVKKWAVGFLLLMFVAHYGYVVKDLYNSHAQLSEGYRIAMTNKGKDIKVPRPTLTKTKYNALHGSLNLGDSPNDWFNQWMAVYWGVKSVEVIKP